MSGLPSGAAQDHVTGLVRGYVLAGGQSSRMGRDKALLEMDGQTLLRATYDLLERVCGQAVVVGPAERYASLGLPLIEDERPGYGPLSGLEAALAECKDRAEWAMVVACDMPSLEERALRRLLVEAGVDDGAQAVVPVSGDGRRQPLCALYRPVAREAVSKQMETGNFRLLEALSRLRCRWVSFDESRHFLNVNTPEEWEAIHARK
ncbi:MAG: molybdenum cofactor guanylyltransferase [Bryobacterales bacterium]|nr:molybdenum cofactor guanylyltransferase [Bryobacterales bacterium]